MRLKFERAKVSRFGARLDAAVRRSGDSRCAFVSFCLRVEMNELLRRWHALVLLCDVQQIVQVRRSANGTQEVVGYDFFEFR